MDNLIHVAGWRSDRATLPKSGSVRKKVVHENGWVDLWGVCATAGFPLVYTEDDPGGARTEIPSPQALRDSCSSLKGVPVTIEHPPRGFLDSTDTKEHQVGMVLDAQYDEETGEQLVHLRVTDWQAWDSVERKDTPELSPGYRVPQARAPRDGDPPGWANADVVQEHREHNHLALVWKGRGDTKIWADSSSARKEESEKMDPENKDQNPVPPAQPDGMAAKMDAMSARMDEMMAKYDASEKARADMQAKYDALEAKYDAMLATPQGDMTPPSNEDEEGNEDELPEGLDEESEMEDGDSPLPQGDSKTKRKGKSNNDSFGAKFVEMQRACKAAEAMGVKFDPVRQDALAIKRDALAKWFQNDSALVSKIQRSKSKVYVDSMFDQSFTAMTGNTPDQLLTGRNARRNDASRVHGDVLAGLNVTSQAERLDAYRPAKLRKQTDNPSK